MNTGLNISAEVMKRLDAAVKTQVTRRSKANPCESTSPQVIERLCYRYPSPLVDAVTELEPGRRIVAVKNVTVNEDFFQGHFPGAPLMPGVLMIETLAQVATVLLMHESRPVTAPAPSCAASTTPSSASRWCRAIGCGSRSRLGPRRTNLARAHGTAYLGDRIVAEAELLLGLSTVGGRRTRRGHDPSDGDRPSGRADRRAARSIGPYATIGEHVRIGRDCRIGASAVIDGWTEIGDANEIFPMASVGLIPQDLKFGGERDAAGDRQPQRHPRVRRRFIAAPPAAAG